MTSNLKIIHQEFGITEEHRSFCKLTICEEASLNELKVVDIDFDGRPFILMKSAAHAW